jgi:phenylalanyl-tRNA synthetase beta chain
VTVPTWRVDVLREADLIEEVARHWGYDHVPAALPALTTPPPAPAFGATAGSRLRRLLAGAGLQEAVTFTFMEKAAAEPFAAPADDLVPIANPLSEKFAVLRPSLLPGLLDSLIYNRRRESASVWLFEVGSVFSRDGETTRVGWMMTGPRYEHWADNGPEADFFSAKGVAELVVAAGNESLEATTTSDYPWYQRGRAARLTLAGRSADAAVVIGHVGQIRPDLVSARGLDTGAVYAGEVLVDARTFAAWAGPVDVTIAAIPRVPSVVRDLSIVVSESLPAADVRGTIWSDPPASLVDVREFDRYQGKGVPAGSVSLSLRLTFRDASRTLTDAEVQQGMDRIVAGLTRAHGAIVRGATGSQAE